MFKQSIDIRLPAALRFSLMLLLGTAASIGYPQAADREPALVWAIDDPGLKWGPCPEFLPKGCALAVLHGDPAKENADVFLRLPPKSSIPLHWHTSAERMILVAGELHATYEGQKTAILKPGAYAYGPAKRPHSAACVSTTPCILFIAFEAPVDAVSIERKE